MQLGQAIDAWVDVHGANLSASTRRDITKIAESVESSGWAEAPCTVVDAGLINDVIRNASNTTLTGTAISEFLNVVVQWDGVQAKETAAPPATSEVSEPEEAPSGHTDGGAFDDLGPAGFLANAADESSGAEESTDDSDESTDDSDESDAEESDSDDEPVYVDGEAEESEDSDDGEPDGDDPEDDDADEEPDEDDPEDNEDDGEDSEEPDDSGTSDDDDGGTPDTAAASAFFDAVDASSPALDDEPLVTLDDESSYTNRKPSGGVFSAAAEEVPAKRNDGTDWITVAYFSVAAICFGLVIFFYLTSG